MKTDFLKIIKLVLTSIKKGKVVLRHELIRFIE